VLTKTKLVSGLTVATLIVCACPLIRLSLFWSVTLYDIDTRALIVNDQKIADRSSRMDLSKERRWFGRHLHGGRTAGRLREELDPDRAR